VLVTVLLQSEPGALPRLAELHAAEATGSASRSPGSETTRPGDDAGTAEPWCVADPPVGRRESARPAEAGTVRGRVVSCAGSLPGARVSIEDRASAAISGLGGLFELAGVPPGTFDLTIEPPGHPQATAAGIQVAPGGITDLGDLLLTDLTGDPEHCNACSQRCPAGAQCVYGICLCPEGFVRCGDTCTALADLENCRACGNRCPAWPNVIPQCGDQDCVFSCVYGAADCDGRRTNGCETWLHSDPNNCGACGYICAPGQECIDFACRWPER
jgi:hypothetical protein